MVRGRRSLLVAGFVTVALVTAACSSSSNHAKTTSGNNGTSATTKPSGAPIRVGVVCSCSGPFGSSVSPAEDVYKAWVSTVNASGGLDGHPVQLFLQDDAANPGTSSSDVQTLLQSDHVVAIADLSIADQTWASAVEAANIPVVGIDVTETPFYTNPDFYPEGQTEDSLAVALVDTAKAGGATNMAYFYCVEAASCGETAPLVKAAGGQVGIPVTYETAIAATAPNYTAQCVAAQQAKITAIAVGDAGPIVAKVGANCALQNFNPVYVTGGEDFSPSLQSASGLKSSLWMEYNDLPYFASNSAMQAMNAALDKYYPGLRTNGTEWSGLASYAWVSGLLLQDAVKGGGLAPSATPTSSEIVKGLESLKADTLQGTAPPLTFQPGKAHPVDCWFTARLQNGVPTVANGGRVTCMSGVS